METHTDVGIMAAAGVTSLVEVTIKGTSKREATGPEGSPALGVVFYSLGQQLGICTLGGSDASSTLRTRTRPGSIRILTMKMLSTALHRLHQRS